MDNQGHKTGGHQKGSRNKSTQERQEAAAETVALIGELIPDAFAGDAHAFLVAIYKDPSQDPLTRKDAAKAALPYEKPRPVTVTLANEGGQPLKVRSELEIGRRLAFVLELIARGEVKAKMPEPFRPPKIQRRPSLRHLLLFLCPDRRLCFCLWLSIFVYQ